MAENQNEFENTSNQETTNTSTDNSSSTDPMKVNVNIKVEMDGKTATSTHTVDMNNTSGSSQYQDKFGIGLEGFYRDSSNGKIFGVCYGFAKKLNIDPFLVRMGTVFVALITGVFPVLIVYILSAIMLPDISKNK